MPSFPWVSLGSGGHGGPVSWCPFCSPVCRGGGHSCLLAWHCGHRDKGAWQQAGSQICSLRFDRGQDEIQTTLSEVKRRRWRRRKGKNKLSNFQFWQLRLSLCLCSPLFCQMVSLHFSHSCICKRGYTSVFNEIKIQSLHWPLFLVKRPVSEPKDPGHLLY